MATEPNYIVSGLERSGTSLMMQILEKGGFPVAYDDSSRPADDNNPRGYYELLGGKIARQIRDRAFDFTPYRGVAIKVTAYGLLFLPPGSYRIVYMTRDIDEILTSMEKMGAGRDEGDRETFTGLNNTVLQHLALRPDIESITVSYADLILHTVSKLKRLNQFLDGQLNLRAATQAIDPGLYRNRAANRTAPG